MRTGVRYATAGMGGHPDQNRISDQGFTAAVRRRTYRGIGAAVRCDAGATFGTRAGIRTGSAAGQLIQAGAEIPNWQPMSSTARGEYR